MSQYYQTYYTTGEFAKLCHTTKETLFHYDKIGILIPQYIKENGYRYYSSRQYFEFDLIKVLQKTKMSLKDIKKFMEERNNQKFIELLEQKYNDLEKEKQKINDMQYRLSQAKEMTEYGMKKPHNIPFIENCQEEHLFTIKLPDISMTDHDMVKYTSQHLHTCQKLHLTEELPMGTIIEKKGLLLRKYKEKLYYTKISHFIDNPHYLLKKEGTYVTILHQGFYDTIEQSYHKLLDFIHENQYEICGDAYEYEIQNYFTSLNLKEYLISISIPIHK
jgi:Predicted transcriptional regulators